MYAGMYMEYGWFEAFIIEKKCKIETTWSCVKPFLIISVGLSRGEFKPKQSLDRLKLELNLYYQVWV